MYHTGPGLYFKETTNFHQERTLQVTHTHSDFSHATNQGSEADHEPCETSDSWSGQKDLEL